MRRRLLSIVLSIALAAFGTFVLVGYVQSAHNKAEAGEPMKSVLVVTKAIARGTKGTEVDGKVRLTKVPSSTVIAGALSSTSSLRGKVASTDLLPGEQLLADRFDTPKALGRAGVPKGLLEVTVKLAPERAVGGAIRVGDTVAVVASFKSSEGDGTSGEGAAKLPSATHVLQHKVLVTNVQGAAVAPKKKSTDKTDESTIEEAPDGAFLVTLALDAESVQQVVFAAEFGSLWLSAEPADAKVGELPIETRGSVYR